MSVLEGVTSLVVKYTEKVLRQPSNALTFSFTFTTGQMLVCILCKFISTEAVVVNLFAILRVFLVGLCN